MSARTRVPSSLSSTAVAHACVRPGCPLLGPVRRAVTTLLSGRHARALLFSKWAGTCSSTSVFLPFSVFVFVHTGWFFSVLGIRQCRETASALVGVCLVVMMCLGPIIGCTEMVMSQIHIFLQQSTSTSTLLDT